MHHLPLALDASYAQHPSFQFNRPPLVLEPGVLDAFNTPYAISRDFGPRLAPQQRDACLQQCEAGLGAVFGSMAAQTGDVQERVFLQELQAECRRLLMDEFKGYAAANLRDAVVFKDPQNQRDALRLLQDRCYFGQLPGSVPPELLAIGAAELARFRENARQGRVTRDDLSVNSGPTVRRIMQMLNREFQGLGVLDAVSAYAASRMTVTALALELSVPQATWWANVFDSLDRAPSTLYAHLDESIVHPKSIVYLTDVDEHNGPTGAYVQALQSMDLNPLQEIVGRVVGNVGNAAASPLRDYYGKKYHQSMSSERFRAHFMRLPREIRFNSHLGWDVCPGSALESSLEQCEKRMVGPAGTFIVFDGARLLHRGGMVKGGERIALQVIFSNATTTSRVLGKIKRAIA